MATQRLGLALMNQQQQQLQPTFRFFLRGYCTSLTIFHRVCIAAIWDRTVGAAI